MVRSAGTTTQSVACSSPGLEQLGAIAALVLALLWPDLSEVGLAGIGSLKRQLRQNEIAQDSVRREVESLRLSLTNNFQSVQNVTVTQDPLLASLLERVEQLSASVNARHDGVAIASPSAPIDYESLASIGTPLVPWVKLSDVVAETGDRFTDTRGLSPAMAGLVESVRQSQVDIDAVRTWIAARTYELRLVDDALRAGASAEPVALGVAFRTARELRAELSERGWEQVL